MEGAVGLTTLVDIWFVTQLCLSISQLWTFFFLSSLCKQILTRTTQTIFIISENNDTKNLFFITENFQIASS